MSLIVTINGEVKTSAILAETAITINKTYGEPWTCELSSFSLDGEVEEIQGDGDAQSWTLGRIPANTPTILVDGVPATVGILGIDTGKEFYWELGTANITQEPTDPAIGVGVEISVDLGTWYPSSGQTITLDYDDGVTSTRLFGGVIRNVERVKDRSSSPLLKCNLQATDYGHILQRRLAGAWELAQTTDNAILAKLMTDVLTAEGITTDTSTAVAIDNFRTENDKVGSALAEVGKLAAKRVWIGPDKVLRLLTPADAPAPFDVPESASNISTLRVTETDEDYANVIVLKSSQTVTAEQTEEFTGDGATTSFELTLPVATVPKVSVNGVENTVGIASVDTGKDWYWSQGSREIRQDSGGVELTALDTLAVTYSGIETQYVTAENSTEIARRAAIEGGTGRYEMLFSVDTLQSQSDAQAMAQAILDSRDEIPLKAVYTTSDFLEPEAKNLQPGQYQAILLDGWASKQNNYMVRSIQMTAMGLPASSEFQFFYTVEAIYGSLTKTLFEWFRDLAGGGSSVSGSAGGSYEMKHFFAGTCEAVAAGTDIGKVRPMLYSPGSVLMVMSDCKTAPTSNLQFDVLVSTDDGSTWNSIFSSGASHTAYTNGPVYFDTFTSAASGLPRGAKFRLDVTSGGSAEGWLLQIVTR